jgi:pilus assembly protein CpaC
MVIGGLMDSRDIKSVKKFPFLGDIPVIGEFFKYTSHSKDKQELIILVTPHLVEEYESTRARMTPEMEGIYRQGQREESAKKDVDLLAPPEEPQEESYSYDESEEKAGNISSSRDGSMLGKYLNRKALPKESPAEDK